MYVFFCQPQSLLSHILSSSPPPLFLDISSLPFIPPYEMKQISMWMRIIISAIVVEVSWYSLLKKIAQKYTKKAYLTQKLELSESAIHRNIFKMERNAIEGNRKTYGFLTFSGEIDVINSLNTRRKICRWSLIDFLSFYFCEILRLVFDIKSILVWYHFWEHNSFSRELSQVVLLRNINRKWIYCFFFFSCNKSSFNSLTFRACLINLFLLWVSNDSTSFSL